MLDVGLRAGPCRRGGPRGRRGGVRRGRCLARDAGARTPAPRAVRRRRAARRRLPRRSNVARTFDVVLALGLFDYLASPARAAAWMRARCAVDARRLVHVLGLGQGAVPPPALRVASTVPDLRLHRGRRAKRCSRRAGFSRVEFPRRGRARLLSATASACEARDEDRARPAAAAQRVRPALGAVPGARDRLRRELAAGRRPRRSSCSTGSSPT